MRSNSFFRRIVLPLLLCLVADPATASSLASGVRLSVLGQSLPACIVHLDSEALSIWSGAAVLYRPNPRPTPNLIDTLQTCAEHVFPPGLAMIDQPSTADLPPLSVLTPHPEMPDVILTPAHLKTLKKLFLTSPPATHAERTAVTMRDLELNPDHRSDRFIGTALASGWFSSHANPASKTAVQRDILSNPANAKGLLIRFTAQEGILGNAASAWYPDTNEMNLPAPKSARTRRSGGTTRRDLLTGFFKERRSKDHAPAHAEMSPKNTGSIFHLDRRRFVGMTMTTLIYTGIIPAPLGKMIRSAPKLSEQAQLLGNHFHRWSFPPGDLLSTFATMRLRRPDELASMKPAVAAFYRERREQSLSKINLGGLPPIDEVRQTIALLNQIKDGDANAAQGYVRDQLIRAKQALEGWERSEVLTALNAQAPSPYVLQQLESTRRAVTTLETLPAQLTPGELAETVRTALQNNLTAYNQWRQINEPKLRKALDEGWRHFHVDVSDEMKFRLDHRLGERRQIERRRRNVSSEEEAAPSSPLPVVVLDRTFWDSLEKAETMLDSENPEVALTFLGQIAWERAFVHEAAHAERGTTLDEQQAEERRVMEIEAQMNQGTKAAFKTFMLPEEPDASPLERLFHLLRHRRPDLYKVLAAPARYRILARLEDRLEENHDTLHRIREFILETYQSFQRHGQPMAAATLRHAA